MPPSLWNDSEPSDDEAHPDSQSATRKRSSRACDQCRKTKSKCERGPTDADQCKSCTAAGIACTYLGPSYKRGPPKGYIHAIEQRWHQVESLLGAILACPDIRAQSIISDLRQDELAREILTRVDTGPFGPSGRINQPAGATKEDFFASILKSNNEHSPARDAARSRRQSRVSREIVSSTQDPALLAVPTMEWQDRLSSRLASSAYASTSSSGFASPFTNGSFPSNPSTFDLSGVPLAQRRRLGVHQRDGSNDHPNWNEMYTMDAMSDNDEYDASTDTADGVGQLSLDENKEVRYHGKASGLHLLGRSDRTDDRNEGGIWKLPMARVWPLAKNRVSYFLSEDDIRVTLPPVDVQDRLIGLYFTHIHPNFPVIHQAQFMVEYNASKYRLAEDLAKTPSPPPDRPEPSQTVSKLLLLSIFAITARYSESPNPPPPRGKMWEVGCDYLNDAREVLTRVFHRSRAATCQALLLLGHREFGIGSMEQGWLYIGMAIRMAHDLGLNRNADKWQFRGSDLFAPAEKQVRKQIWWTCCTADKYGSVYMGRPVSINESDYDTPLPDIYPQEEDQPWQPLPYDTMKLSYPPVPGRIFSCFRAEAALSVIVGSIMSLIYPVRSSVRTSRRATLAMLETRLDQWYIELPEGLRYDSASKRLAPPPNILFLHIKYWGAVLLLHRAFIPNWKGSEKVLRQMDTNTASLKAFDLCQGAASHISSIVTVYHETFSLKCTSPFLSSYLFSAGIMHVITLTLRPSNMQASLGLQQCLTALKEMEIVWPSAQRAWDLLHGVKVHFDGPLTQHGPDRHKRHAEDAFGREKSSDYLQREAFGALEQSEPSPPGLGRGVQDLSNRMLAHMLGLDIPGIEPSTSYYPGYEWWPRTADATGSQMASPMVSSGMTASTPMTTDTPVEGVPISMPFDTHPGLDWMQSSENVPSYYDFSTIQGPY